MANQTTEKDGPAAMPGRRIFAVRKTKEKYQATTGTFKKSNARIR
jgi:hypothetical protein